MNNFFCLNISFLKFIPDFENLYNLIHLNDVSDTKTTFDDSSTSDSEN